MARSIFEDSDSEENDEKLSDIEINQGYAKRFEHNKKREALQRLEELKKKGFVSDSEESSDDDDPEDEAVASGTSKSELQFYDALIKVKRKDPVIQQQDAKLYSDEDKDEQDEDEEEQKVAKKKEKPLYIKDVVAKHLLEDGPDFGEEPVKLRQSQSKVYSKEQEENLKAFLEAADDAMGDDGDDELFEKKKSKAGDESEGEGRLEVKKKVDEYWGDDGALDENELFLKNFFSKKMWADKTTGGDEPVRGSELELLSDEEELEKQEKYEAEYNFRYEEGTGDRVLGHARRVDGSVRKKKNSRKTQRKKREERMAQAEFERKEELKHLKNLKRKEIEERLDKIRTIAGMEDGNSCKLTKDDLEEEFDPEEYDRKMKETFGMDYYEADDVDPGFGSGTDNDLEKPDFDREDELLGLPKDWDVIGTGAGFKVARERSLKHKTGIEEEKVEDDVEEDQQYESKRKRKRKISLREKVELDKELEEYYKLDYEDTIGDLRTRFKYKSVTPNRYGLNAADLLMADEKELNQYVSLKKLAPYRQEEWKVPKIKRHQTKMKLQVWEGKSKSEKNKKHNAKHSSKTEPKGKTQQEAPVEEEPPSKRSKRRRRQAEIKLTQSRLLAYGKISSDPKKQKKQKH